MNNKQHKNYKKKINIVLIPYINHNICVTFILLLFTYWLVGTYCTWCTYVYVNSYVFYYYYYCCCCCCCCCCKKGQTNIQNKPMKFQMTKYYGIFVPVSHCFPALKIFPTVFLNFAHSEFCVLLFCL